jgi:hypothetical protein
MGNMSKNESHEKKGEKLARSEGSTSQSKQVSSNKPSDNAPSKSPVSGLSFTLYSIRTN